MKADLSCASSLTARAPPGNALRVMSAPDDRKPGALHESDDEIDRAAILERRRALLRRAVRSVGAVVLGVMASDCGPEPCLSVIADVPNVGDASDASDAGPQPCLAPQPPDAGDAGPMALDGDASAPDAEPDAEPMPCLSPPLPDVQEGDSSPMPCLSMPPPDAGG